MATPFKITIHMVASVDGFIAKRDNSVSWFETADTYEKGVTGEDAGEFLKTIDCYVMGARTYEHALALSRSYGWAYGDTPTIVMTHRELPVERANIELYSGSLETLVSERLKPRFGNVWVVGGAELVRALLQAGLADELRMTILPVMLGDGLRFFDDVGQEQGLHLKDVTAYKNGMIELWYEIRR
jgi:dihydrofolate reductase